MYTKKVNQLKQKHKDLCNDFVLDNFLFFCITEYTFKKKRQRKEKKNETNTKQIFNNRTSLSNSIVVCLFIDDVHEILSDAETMIYDDDDDCVVIYYRYHFLCVTMMLYEVEMR